MIKITVENTETGKTFASEISGKLAAQSQDPAFTQVAAVMWADLMKHALSTATTQIVPMPGGMVEERSV